MAENESHDRLRKKLEKLEERVRRIERYLRDEGRSADRVVVDRDDPRHTSPQNPPETESMWDQLTLGENWLNRIGIALLLLGVVFLFKYSIDQGWLIPPVRSAFGLAVGLGLFAFGYEMDERRAPTKQLLLGGGIAAFYITGFATFQLYSFVSYTAVWAFMVVVTLLALSLSLRQDQSILSVLGTLGGLGTPFMLYRGEGSLTYLVLYTCLVLAGSGAIYYFKGWSVLLWTSVVGGWAVIGTGWISRIVDQADPLLSDSWALQAGLLFGLGVFWAVPVLRVLAARKGIGSSLLPSVEGEADLSGTGRPADPNVQVASVLVPVATLIISYGIWSLSQQEWGLIAAGGALLAGVAYIPLRREVPRLAMAHGLSSLILVTVALLLLLEGNILFIALALEGLALRVIASKTGNTAISTFSHIVFGVVGYWLVDRLMSDPAVGGPVLVNLEAVTQLFVIGVAGLAAPVYMEKRADTMTYRLSAHIAMLGWLLKELVVLDSGQAFVSITWGLYAIGIITVGFLRDNNRLRLIGMGTVFLVVGKLFLVDLSQIQALLRIVLFIGFGVLFLAFGYYLQTRWSGDRD